MEVNIQFENFLLETESDSLENINSLINLRILPFFLLSPLYHFSD